jgi:hypothetical protein
MPRPKICGVFGTIIIIPDTIVPDTIIITDTTRITCMTSTAMRGGA